MEQTQYRDMETSVNMQNAMGMNASASTNYAGFWIRLVAYIIDAIVLLIPGYVIEMVVPMPVSSILTMIVGAVYVIYFLSSEMMATPGKMAMGLIVTDGDGNRISSGTAATRWIGYFISAIVLLIGFFMIGFTEKKEGLHDKLAGTLVVYKN
jgi:uncharacterized RDD family membrane protein YckC